MEEALFRWIERFGFPAAMVVVCIIAISRLFSKNEKDRADLSDLQKLTVRAMTENTDATKVLTEAFKKSIGSGPVCKSSECKAAEAGNLIVAELRRLELGKGISDKNILRIVDAVKARHDKEKAEAAHAANESQG